jgi:hypothetical protein
MFRAAHASPDDFKMLDKSITFYDNYHHSEYAVEVTPVQKRRPLVRVTAVERTCRPPEWPGSSSCIVKAIQITGDTVCEQGYRDSNE